MSNSSQPQDYLTTSTNIDLGEVNITTTDNSDLTMVSSDSFTITLNNDTIDFNSLISNTSTAAQSTYTIGNVDTIVLDNLDSITSFNWNDQKTEFQDSFPDWTRVQNMCEKYPGLEIALRNFQTVYTLVKDDYDNPKDET